MAGVSAMRMLEKVPQEVELVGMRIEHHHRHHHLPLHALQRCSLRRFWGVSETCSRCSRIWRLSYVTSLTTPAVGLTQVATK